MSTLAARASTLTRFLKSKGACEEAVTWAEGKTFAEAWKSCQRGDWMLWLCGKMSGEKSWPTRREVVLAACACAETALKYVPKGEDRPRLAIETARRWADGKATLQEVRVAAAYAAAYAAYAARKNILNKCADICRHMLTVTKEVK